MSNPVGDKLVYVWKQIDENYEWCSLAVTSTVIFLLQDFKISFEEHPHEIERLNEDIDGYFLLFRRVVAHMLFY